VVEGRGLRVEGRTQAIGFAGRGSERSLILTKHSFGVSMPPYWQKFVEQHGLVGREIFVPPDCDLSGVGAEIETLDESSRLTEQTELYPGMAVSSAGFVPVGDCSLGSGDPYFINERDGQGGPLYRIYHDQVTDQSYDAVKAIAVVLRDYKELMKYADA
jgi:hypothetical protein